MVRQEVFYNIGDIKRGDEIEMKKWITTLIIVIFQKPTSSGRGQRTKALQNKRTQ